MENTLGSFGDYTGLRFCVDNITEQWKRALEIEKKAKVI